MLWIKNQSKKFDNQENQRSLNLLNLISRKILSKCLNIQFKVKEKKDQLEFKEDLVFPQMLKNSSWKAPLILHFWRPIQVDLEYRMLRKWYKRSRAWGHGTKMSFWSNKWQQFLNTTMDLVKIGLRNIAFWKNDSFILQFISYTLIINDTSRS